MLVRVAAAACEGAVARAHLDFIGASSSLLLRCQILAPVELFGSRFLSSWCLAEVFGGSLHNISTCFVFARGVFEPHVLFYLRFNENVDNVLLFASRLV